MTHRIFSRFSIPSLACAFALALSACLCHVAPAADVLSEPGPENGGLRLRWSVVLAKTFKHDVFDVRVELLNVSKKPITLRTDWEKENPGDVKEYLVSSAEIESYPAFAPMRGATSAEFERRTSPQAELTLQGGETLTLEWRSESLRLKKRATDRFFVNNPHFSEPGLYSVHAHLDVVTNQGTIHLRSNEQLVSIGGSLQTPKGTFGRLESANIEKKKGTLDIGSNQKVQIGDRFDITAKSYAWRLTITEVSPRFSEGKLERLPNDSDSPAPEPKAGAELVTD